MSAAPDTYVCQECGGEFEFGRPNEEAHAEAQEQFGRDGHAPDMAIICHDCYLEIAERFGWKVGA